MIKEVSSRNRNEQDEEKVDQFDSGKRGIAGQNLNIVDSFFEARNCEVTDVGLPEWF